MISLNNQSKPHSKRLDVTALRLKLTFLSLTCGWLRRSVSTEEHSWSRSWSLESTTKMNPWTYNWLWLGLILLWRSVCSKMTHLVIVLWPNTTEAFAAAKIIDCHMVAFVPGDDIIQIKNSVFFCIDSITCYSNPMFSYVFFTFHYKNWELFSCK